MQVHCWLALLNPLQIKKKKISWRTCHLLPAVMFMAWSPLISQKLGCAVTLKLEQQIHLSAHEAMPSYLLLQNLQTLKSIRQPEALLGNFSFCFFPPTLADFFCRNFIKQPQQWLTKHRPGQQFRHLLFMQNNQSKATISPCFNIPTHYWNRCCYKSLSLRFTSCCRLAIFPMRKSFPSNRAVLQPNTTWKWASKSTLGAH